MPTGTPFRKYAELIGEIVTADPNPTIVGLRQAIKDKKEKRLYPIGTEIPDTCFGVDNPLIVADYMTIPLARGGEAYAAACIRKHVYPTDYIYVSKGSSTKYLSSALYNNLQNYVQNCSKTFQENVANAEPTGAGAIKVFPLTAAQFGAKGSTETLAIWKQKGLVEPSNGPTVARRLRTPTGGAIRVWTRTQFTNTGVYVLNPDGSLEGIYLDDQSPRYGAMIMCYFTAAD